MRGTYPISRRGRPVMRARGISSRYAGRRGGVGMRRTYPISRRGRSMTRWATFDGRGEDRVHLRNSNLHQCDKNGTVQGHLTIKLNRSLNFLPGHTITYSVIAVSLISCGVCGNVHLIIDEHPKDFEVVTDTPDSTYHCILDGVKFNFLFKLQGVQRIKTRCAVRDSKMEDIYTLMKDPYQMVFQVVAGCGYGKSTSILTDILDAMEDLKIIVVEPRVIVARSNAGYVASELGYKAKFIVRGMNLDLMVNQPRKSLIYCSTGKFNQMLELFSEDRTLTKNLCVVMSDWHVRDREYAMNITEAATLLRTGVRFKLILSSAFSLCDKWENDINLGEIPKVVFPQISCNY